MRHLKNLALAWLQGLAELLLYFPVFAAVYVIVPRFALSVPEWLAVISVMYALGYAFHYMLRSVWQLLAWIGSVAVPAACAWQIGGSPLMIAVSFLSFAAAWIRGRQNRLRGWDRSFSTGVWWIGMIGYFIASFVYPRLDETAPFSPWITGFGIVALALTLYRTNSSTLDKESQSREGAPIAGETRWRNRALLFGLFALILLLASFRTLAAAAAQAGAALFGGAIALLLQLLNMLRPEEAERSNPPQQPLDLSQLFGESKPSALALFLQKVMYIVVALIMLAAAIWLLYLLVKHGKRWLHRFMGWYGERLESSDTGYVDEKQSLLDSKEWARERADAWKRRFTGWFGKEPGWDDLTDNRERVRHAFKRLLLGRIAGGYKHHDARTPRETGRELIRRSPLRPDEETALRLYEEVRYGGKEVSDEQAAEVKTLFGAGSRNKPRK
jgi:hypothetical protein